MDISTFAIKFWDLAGIAVPGLLFILLIGALILDATLQRRYVQTTGYYTLAGLILTLCLQMAIHLARVTVKLDVGQAFGGLYFFDLYSIYFNYIFLSAAILTVAMSFAHLENKYYHQGEYYILIICATIGMCLMAGARDLIVIFLGLETMSIPIYVLAGFDRRNPRSNEAALKYLLLGAFATGFLLFGMALLYGIGSSTNLQSLATTIIVNKTQQPAGYTLILTAISLVLVGFGFKIAAVPFHMWVPDVYEGAPTPITGFMATGVKAAAFAALLRLFLTAFSSSWVTPNLKNVELYNILWVLAVLTMTLGNFVAIAQTNIKRMLAYSSIAHAGYILIGITSLVALNDLSNIFLSAGVVMFYLLAYTFMNIGAFGIIVALSRDKESGENLSDFAGLGWTRPGLAALMTIFMLSLTGMPPLAGFAGKFFIFRSAIQSHLYSLAIIGVMNSVVSAYYYLRVIVIMYMHNPEEGTRPEPSFRLSLLMVNAISAVLTVAIGLFPNSFLQILYLLFTPKHIV